MAPRPSRRASLWALGALGALWLAPHVAAAPDRGAWGEETSCDAVRNQPPLAAARLTHQHAPTTTPTTTAGEEEPRPVEVAERFLVSIP